MGDQSHALKMAYVWMSLHPDDWSRVDTVIGVHEMAMACWELGRAANVFERDPCPMSEAVDRMNAALEKTSASLMFSDESDPLSAVARAVAAQAKRHMDSVADWSKL